MFINNGGVRFVRNVPNPTIASGVWSIGDIQIATLYSYWKSNYSNSGWFAGGNLSSTHRIYYNNDTSTAALRGNLTRTFNLAASSGNNSFGWFSGTGFPPVSSVNRIEYNTDTNVASSRGPLASSVYGHAGTGNNSYGWHAGGSGSIGAFTGGATLLLMNVKIVSGFKTTLSTMSLKLMRPVIMGSTKSENSEIK